MPSTITDLFGAADLQLGGPVKWDQPVDCNQHGVYIVSLSPDPNYNDEWLIDTAPISEEAVARWIADVPGLTVDGRRPKPEELVSRLSEFWLPDEAILYIGCTAGALGLGRRVQQYYCHVLGNPRPHSGGHWIKALSVLDCLTVFWAPTETPYPVEACALKAFVNGMSEKTRMCLRDPDRPFPFANLEYPRGNRKNHGIKRSRANR